MYVKLFILFYADDTVIISESADGLHILLMSFIHIGTKGNTVNVDKTKIMVFSKGPTPTNVFYFHDEVIESMKEYKYLSIIVSRSGSFCKAKNKNKQMKQSKH